jgi:hypothetical protein
MRPILGMLVETDVLQGGGLTADQIVERLSDADAAEVRLEIANLESEFLIAHPSWDDNAYLGTDYGVSRLADLNAYGKPTPMPDPLTHEQQVAFLESAMRWAIWLREEGRVKDATARFTIIAEQASKDDLNLPDLAARAREAAANATEWMVSARAEMADIEASRPLRRPVLNALSTGTALALAGLDAEDVFAQLSIASREEISRELEQLETEGCIFGAGDGGWRRFAMTKDGDHGLAKYRAWGKSEPALPGLTPENVQELLGMALRTAEEMLGSGDVYRADMRLQVVAQQDRKTNSLGVPQLALRAEAAMTRAVGTGLVLGAG